MFILIQLYDKFSAAELVMWGGEVAETRTARAYILKVKQFAESAFQSQKICGKSA